MIVGLVLAAGASARMGRPKAWLPVGSECFLTRVCRVLAEGGLTDLVVVTGPETADVGRCLSDAGISARLIENRNRDRGQLSSLQAGLTLADRPGVDAVLVHLVDAPLVRPATVRAVIEAFHRTRAPIVRPLAGTRHGHPVVFARPLFDDLRTADPALGAKAVVRAHAERAVDVPVDDPGVYEDIDTPEDYRRLIGDITSEAG